jgi:serine/threonine protein kinase
VIAFRLTAVNFGDKLFDNAKEDRYTVVNFIAKDRLGPVFLVQDLIRESQEKYLIRLNFNHLNGALAALRDLWPIKYLRHRNIIECDDLFIVQRGDENLEIAYLLYFVTNQYWQNDLSTLLARCMKRGTTLPHSFIRDTIFQICSSLHYMHKHGLVHGEVRAMNVMLMGSEHVRLNTFTNTRVYGNSTDTHYRAPEAMVKNAVLTTASDMFSLGVLIYEMFTLKKKVEHSTFVKDNEYGNTLAEEVYRICGERSISNLISNLIRSNASERLSASQVLDILNVTRETAFKELMSTGMFSDVTIIL